MGLTDQLAGRRVYFDTNIFIYLLEGFAQAELQIQEIRAAILSGSCEVYTSELTLCELLVLPFRNKNSEMIKHYRQFLEESGAVTLVPTSRETRSGRRTTHAGA